MSQVRIFFFVAVLSVVRVYATPLFQTNATVTLGTQSVLENGFCQRKKYPKEQINREKL